MLTVDGVLGRRKQTLTFLELQVTLRRVRENTGKEKANVRKCSYLGNLDERHMTILCTVFATFLLSLKLFQN